MSENARFMSEALATSRTARRLAPPNPWVGCVIVRDGVEIARAATAVPGGLHAEAAALAIAGDRARGATLYSTLEPCSHVGRTGPCTDAIIDAGVARVIVSIEDPDVKVAGSGLQQLRDAGVEVDVGELAEAVTDELAAYLWHRRCARPFVIAKVASTIDGRVAMADGSSQWITSEPARADAHELRADSQAIVVGAGTVRRDDPSLTARTPAGIFEPIRVVLGRAPEGAKVHPCWERSGDLGAVLDELGAAGVLQLLVEGGPSTTSAFLEAGMINRFVWYFAPAFAGAANGVGALSDRGTTTMSSLQRGRVRDVRRIGEDVRVEMEI